MKKLEDMNGLAGKIGKMSMATVLKPDKGHLAYNVNKAVLDYTNKLLMIYGIKGNEKCKAKYIKDNLRS